MADKHSIPNITSSEAMDILASSGIRAILRSTADGWELTLTEVAPSNNQFRIVYSEPGLSFDDAVRRAAVMGCLRFPATELARRVYAIMEADADAERDYGQWLADVKNVVAAGIGNASVLADDDVLRRYFVYDMSPREAVNYIVNGPRIPGLPS